MCKIWIVICIAAILIAPRIFAGDEAQKARSAEGKAQALEQNAASEGDKSRPAESETITKPEAQAVDPTGENPLDDALTCLARSIYWEARGEEAAGIEAIAHVVMNRLGHEGFPDTICEVVRQGREEGACQFSWWCDGRSDDAQEDQAYSAAKEIARKVLNKQIPDRTGGALYFHQEDISPAWTTKYVKTAKVGNHVFYKPRDGAPK
ncbi:MAG: cell wall hydrolase [Deltaproteobacteria bacterium HGW-Deltaproteobacteria-18]|jgi:spore germination cell wall hydrolase CwlJ-like protein|nr:MAG: cell wall hydrolase [Deltaproteobacteria bacterium HGW-Deltaproteobacteria-18]